MHTVLGSGAPTRYLNFVADSAYDYLVSQGSDVRISYVENVVQSRARELGPHVLVARATRDFRAYCLPTTVLGQVGDCVSGSLMGRLAAASIRDFDVVGRGAVRGFDYFEVLHALAVAQIDPSVALSLDHPYFRRRVPIGVRHELMPVTGVRSVALSFDRRYLREWRGLDITSKLDLVCRIKRGLIHEAKQADRVLEVVQIGVSGGRTFPILAGELPGLGEYLEGHFSPPTPTVIRVRQLEVTVWRLQWLGAALCFCLTIGTLWALSRSNPTAPSEI